MLNENGVIYIGGVATHMSLFGRILSFFYAFGDVNCHGHETKLVDCQYLSSTECEADAGVICGVTPGKHVHEVNVPLNLSSLALDTIISSSVLLKYYNEKVQVKDAQKNLPTKLYLYFKGKLPISLLEGMLILLYSVSLMSK